MSEIDTFSISGPSVMDEDELTKIIDHATASAIRQRAFLDEYWDKIQPNVGSGIPEGIEATGYIRPWNHDTANMNMILKAIKLLNPVKVIELGTFEGMGTKLIAETLNGNNIQSFLWTFDAGKPTEGWPESAIPDIMGQWDRIEAVRRRRIKTEYKNTTIRYYEGLTKDTLPAVMPEIGTWDFCFQDSVHQNHEIIEELACYESYSKVGSIIVFDDIIEGHPFIEWFRNNMAGWIFRHTTIGRSQLWAERII